MIEARVCVCKNNLPGMIIIYVVRIIRIFISPETGEQETKLGYINLVFGL